MTWPPQHHNSDGQNALPYARPYGKGWQPAHGLRMTWLVSATGLFVPFWVPTEYRGLGLGLSALLRSGVTLSGRELGFAQLYSHRGEGGPREVPEPVEAMVTPEQWAEVAGSASQRISVVVTGAFEPPAEGTGHLKLVAFDPTTREEYVRVDAEIDAERCGADLVRAMGDLARGAPLDVSALTTLDELDWQTLQDVLHAERAAVTDPVRNEPYDIYGAIVHLGRALDEQPLSTLIADRLSRLSLELLSRRDARYSRAALRALHRAIADAPDHLSLVETAAQLHAGLGEPQRAEVLLNEVLARAPKRMRAYAILAQALRLQAKFEAARTVLDTGLTIRNDDVRLLLEYGEVHYASGEVERAKELWMQLVSERRAEPALERLAQHSAETKDAALAQCLVDFVLAHTGAFDATGLRLTIMLALNSEVDDLARAVRLERLLLALTDFAPEDPWAMLHLARSYLRQGRTEEAASILAQVEAIAGMSPVGAEARRAHFAVENPEAALGVDAALRLAYECENNELGAVCVQARELAQQHNVWTAQLAAGVALGRMGELSSAAVYLRSALEQAGGSGLVHVAMGRVQLRLGDLQRALDHAERALALEGETPPALVLFGEALVGMGRVEEASTIAARLRALGFEDLAMRVIPNEAQVSKERPSILMQLRARVRKIFKN